MPPLPPPPIPPRRTSDQSSWDQPKLPPRPPPKAEVPPLDLGLLYDLPSLELRARYVMDGFLTGMHRSARKGFSVEFAEYRAYQQGDDPRRIDWRLFGRSDRLQVKLFEEETQLRVFLVLDTSASMAFSGRPGAWLRKIDFARTILAALGLLAMRQTDAFSLALIGSDLDDYLKPKATQSHWQTMLARLDGLKTGGPTGLAKGLTTLAELLPERALVVIASDFYEESAALDAAINRLRYEKHELIAFHVLDPVEIDLNEDWNGNFIDSETGQKLVLDTLAVRKGYLERFKKFLAETEASFLNQAGHYSLLRTDANPLTALGEYLGHRDRLC